MKEFQDIQKINIRLAQKFEKMGYFKEADRIDNMNFMLSQRIIIASGAGPTQEQLDSIGKGLDKSINVGKFVKGVELAIEKLTGKPVALGNILGAPAIVKVISNLFSYGILAKGVYDFFVGLTNDMSGVHGDTPKELVLIASYLSDIASGISYIMSISSGSTPLVATGGALAIASIIAKIVAGYMTDETDYGKKEYPGGAEQLLQDAFKKEFPESTKEWKDVNKDNLTVFILRKLKDRIFKIVKEGNFTATSMQQAYQAMDRAQKSVVTPSARDLAKQRGLMKKPDYRPFGNPEIDVPVY
jgi:hypothetical protein